MRHEASGVGNGGEDTRVRAIQARFVAELGVGVGNRIGVTLGFADSKAAEQRGAFSTRQEELEKSVTVDYADHWAQGCICAEDL